MPTLMEKRAEVVQHAKSIFESANGRALTGDERAKVKGYLDEAESLNVQIRAAHESKGLYQRLAGSGVDFAADGSIASASSGRDGQFWDVSEQGLKTAAKVMVGKIDQAGGVKALVGGSGLATTVEMTPQPYGLGRPPTNLLQVLPSIVRGTPTYRYLRQTSRVNNAAVVAPHATKPVSTYGITPEDGALQVWAHLSEPLDTYLLADNANLQPFVAGELLYGLSRAVEAHAATVLTGGAGISTAFASDAVTSIRQGITGVQIAGYTPGAIVLSPVAWQGIVTRRISTGAFDVADGPVDDAEQKLWGVQVVVSVALTDSEALILGDGAAGLSTDGGVQTRWFDQPLASTNEVQARCEGRFAVDVFQPGAIATVALSA